MYAGNPAEALPCFEEAEKEDPNYVKTYINKKLCLAGLENYSDGVEYSNKLIEAGLADSITYFHLALTWDEQGNETNAVRNYKTETKMK